MHNRTAATVCDKRGLSEKEAQAYTGYGRSSVRKLGAEIGAIKHYGKRIVYDKQVLDAYFDGTLEKVN